MATPHEKVLHEALQLSALERAELVEKLLSSFDFPARSVVDSAWGREAEERIDAFEKGNLKAKSAHQIFSEIGKNKS